MRKLCATLAGGLLLALVACGTDGSSQQAPSQPSAAPASSAAAQSEQPPVASPDKPCGDYAEPPAAAEQPVEEIACNRNGTPVFGAANGSPRPAGVPSRIPFGTHVHIKCYASAEAAGMPSVNAWYVIADGPFAGTYGSANTFWNGGMDNDLNQRVRPCT